MIRQGQITDFDQILPLCEQFWSYTEYDEPFEPEEALNKLNLACEFGLLGVVELDDEIVGFCAGAKAPLLGNANSVVGVELAWWINPEHRNSRWGSKLFDFMEQLARDAGIKYWCMVSLQSCNPDPVNRFYESKGYHLTEMTYMRCLWPS